MRTKSVLLALLLSAFSFDVYASHLRAGEIIVRRIDCNSLEVEITIIAYINTINTNVPFGGANDLLFFGDGVSIVVPETAPTVVIDAELGVAKVVFKTTYGYASHGTYLIRYLEPNRNGGVVNFAGSINTPFHLETSITLESGTCNSSPVLLIAPMDRACAGLAFYHNPGAVDAENDSLSFEMVIPKRNIGINVTDYLFPNHQSFYTDYNTANEAGSSTPIFVINPVDGTITWDAPEMTGEYAIAFKIIEWKFRNSDSTWYQAGYVVRDMQILVEECSNKRPQLTLGSEFCVIAGEPLQFTAPASDPDGDPVRIEIFSELFGRSDNKPIVAPPIDVLQSTQAPHDTASVTFLWQPSCEDVRDEPYTLVFKISDKPVSSGTRLIQFYPVTIKVIAPEPEYEMVTVNPVSKTVTIEWKDYPCDNVQAFQVWRRISKHEYTQPQCENGMPAFLRYNLLAEVNSSVNSFKDTDVDHGALYCYRIVALVGNNNIPGRISLDTCIIPKPAEAPIITNVSVFATGVENGDMVIRWTKPFQIDASQYPAPYSYRVFRAVEPGDAFAAASPIISDTVFHDQGLNTESASYRYKVELYVPSLTTDPVDTSSAASSVFLTATPRVDAIDLTWHTNTPWSNYSQNFPNHLIFRRSGLSDEFKPIDSVNVNENGFHYRDDGRYQDTELLPQTDYYYKIVTRGTYGNPQITEPLENTSQIVRVQLLDISPPCTPLLSIITRDCREFACGDNSYYNVLQWEYPDNVCAGDVVSHELVIANEDGSTFAVTLGDTRTFRHDDLNSLEKCYRIVGIDAAGNRSDRSAMVCNVNCFNFKLPNVMTPDLEDSRNDVLTPFTAENANESDCSRSVKQVNLKIFNRWGEEIYTTSASGENNFMLWEGISQQGTDVTTGTYYYLADVQFETTDPSKQSQQVKGWVHVLR